MFRSAITASLLLATLSACQPTPAQQAEQTPVPPVAEPQPEIDLFTLAIEAGRWSVIIDQARNGVREAPFNDRDEDLTLRIDESLKSGAAELLLLRNQACRKGLATGQTCVLPDWPAWTIEPPTAGTDPAILQQRSEWLGAAVSELSGIGCEAGRTATGDERFCAVE